jgi:hypothetical protein
MITQNQIVIATASLCSAAGVGLGYFATKKRFEHVYAEMLQEETEKTKEFYKGLYEKKLEESLMAAAVSDESFIKALEKQKPVDLNEVAEETVPSTMVEEASDALLSYAGINEPPKLSRTTEEVVEEKPAPRSEKKQPERVFYNNVSKSKSPKVPEARTIVPLKSDIPGEELPPQHKAPYVISQDTFMSAELDYDQETVTYYDVDGVVTNQADIQLERVNDTIGLTNLMKFAELAGADGDPNVLYIRSERFRTDYEIVRDMGMYSEKVLDQGAD